MPTRGGPFTLISRTSQDILFPSGIHMSGSTTSLHRRSTPHVSPHAKFGKRRKLYARHRITSRYLSRSPTLDHQKTLVIAYRYRGVCHYHFKNLTRRAQTNVNPDQSY